VFTPDRRGQVPEGHTPWDLEPGSLMTNAIIGGMVQTSNGRELNARIQGGLRKKSSFQWAFLYSPRAGRPLDAGSRAYVVSAPRSRRRNLSAAGGTVSKDGVKPAN